MSERERWIVYPLLFLALGSALRDKLLGETTSKRIVCQELTVQDEGPPVRELVRIGRDPRSANSKAQGLVWVEGTVNAQEYAVDGHPLGPAILSTIQDSLIRLLQQGISVHTTTDTPNETRQPPAPESDSPATTGGAPSESK